MNDRNKKIISKLDDKFRENKSLGLNTALSFNGNNAIYEEISTMIDKIGSYELSRERKKMPITEDEKMYLILLLANLKNNFLDKLKFFDYAIDEHNQNIRDNPSLPSSLSINDLNDEFNTKSNLKLSNIEIISKIIYWSNRISKSCDAFKSKAIEENEKSYKKIQDKLYDLIYFRDRKVECDFNFIDAYFNSLLENKSEDEILDDPKYQFFEKIANSNDSLSMEEVIEKFRKEFGNDDKTLSFLNSYNTGCKMFTIEEEFVNIYTKFLNKEITEDELKENLAYQKISELIENNDEFKDISFDNLYQMITYNNLRVQSYIIKDAAIELFFKEYCELSKTGKMPAMEIAFSKNQDKKTNSKFDTILNIFFNDYFNSISVHFDSELLSYISIIDPNNIDILKNIPNKSDNPVDPLRLHTHSLLNFKLSKEQISDIRMKTKNSTNKTSNFYFHTLNISKPKEKMKGVNANEIE